MPDATSRKDANTDRTGTQYPAGVAPGSRRSIRINRTSSRRLAVTSSGGENPTHSREPFSMRSLGVLGTKVDQKHRKRINQAALRSRLRAQINAIKSAAGCIICGERHPACLQFHHKDPDTKLASICHSIAGRLRGRKLMAEIEKCDVLCANCHAKQHWIDRQKINVS